MAASLSINAAAVTVIGYRQLTGAAAAENVARKETPPTRLVELEELKAAKAEPLKASSRGSGSGSGPGSGDSDDSKGGNSDEVSDSGSQLLNGKSLRSATGQKADVHRESARGGKDSAKGRNANFKSGLTRTGKLELSVPKAGIVHGLNGVIDLSKAHIDLKLHADPSKVSKNQPPNKIIGHGKITIMKNGAEMTAQCVAKIGGNTVYPGNLKVILGPGIKISGTKYCGPGSSPIPGSGSGGGSFNPGSSNLPYSQLLAQAMQTTDPSKLGSTGLGSKGLGSTGLGRNGLGKNGAGREGSGGSENGLRSGSARAGLGRAGSGSAGSGSGLDSASDQEPQKIIGIAKDVIGIGQDPNQVALDERYRAFASGPVHGIDDAKYKDVNMGLQVQDSGFGRERQELHLPETHGDPTDLVKAGGGSDTKSSSRSNNEASQRKTPFEPAPISVGSHSERGTIRWGPDSQKIRKNGLTGAYYIGRNFDEYHVTRVYKNIDYNWTGKEVDPKLPMGQAFSVRWTGFIKPRYSETYTIYTTSDDGVRLWIGNKLLIKNWNIHAAVEDVVKIPMVAGKEYPITLEYFEQTGLTISIIKLYWESASQKKEYVPAACLFPTRATD